MVEPDAGADPRSRAGRLQPRPGGACAYTGQAAEDWRTFLASRGREPELADPKEQLVYRFARELVTNSRVSDATYEAATRTFGTTGAVELAAMVGYYAMIAMTLNAHAIMPPGERPFQD